MINVLYAEDDDDDADFFKEALSESLIPTKFTRVKNGIELMELLANNDTCDIIFLDYIMPLKNGFQCLTEIRANEKYNNLPIIIFTTSSTEGMIKWLYDLGANLLVQKPSDFNLWKQAIDKILLIDFKEHTPFSSFSKFILPTG